MKTKPSLWIAVVAVCCALAVPVALPAQNAAKQHHPHQYHHYQIVDPGTFGGPWSGLQNPQLPRAGVLNNSGTLVGIASTPAWDPYCGCNASDAFQYQDGVITDLGRVPGGIDSQANWISGNGLIAGLGDNGVQDPLAGFPIPYLHGLLWDHGIMTDLGTLPEGGNLVFPVGVNNRGEVVGNAQNTVPDPNSMFPPYPTQTRAFYWKDGVMQDIGTLPGGTDAAAALINERGEVVGWSYTNSTATAACTFPLTTGTFIWDKKNGMQDIGTFGGTCTIAYDLNNRGRVVGASNNPGDATNLAFVWDRATGMTELTTAGAGGAFAVNDAGDVAGYGYSPDGQYVAILWRQTGGKWRTTYLGLLHSGDDFAAAWSINASAQVVGNSSPDGGSTNLPFLWEDGGPMVDLNALIPPNSGIQLVEADQINDRGEIAAAGVDANGNGHAFLLIPCDENHRDAEGCDYSMVDAATAAAQNPARPYVPSTTQNLSRSRWSNRFHMRGLPAASK